MESCDKRENGAPTIAGILGIFKLMGRGVSQDRELPQMTVKWLKM
jgi:hypothetical protein